eukprot:5354142-Pyramimonas_sp.AAC.1
MPQLVDRTSGESLLYAERLRSCVSDAASSFRFRTRGICHDTAGQNDRSERGLMQLPGKNGWRHTRNKCEFHIIVVGMQKAFSFYDILITAQIHFALVVNEGTNMIRLGRVVVEKAKELLD